MSIFEEGSPFQGFLNKVTDLLILNLVTLLLCLPVITAGAALTAMHYVLLKMVRGEEGYIVKSFFRAFKREFRQATVSREEEVIRCGFPVPSSWWLSSNSYV